jgi:hypothetical protein
MDIRRNLASLTAAAPGAAVVPIDWTMFTSTPPTDADSQRARTILLNSNRYSLTHWYHVRGYDTQSGYYLDFGSTGEHRIRSAGSVAMALAVSLRLGIYDSGVVTVSRAVAEGRALKLTRSLAYRHQVNRGLFFGWGRGWQSALWALYAGTAGWLMWDRLPPGDAELVRKMVEDEAIRLVGFAVGYWRGDNDQLDFPPRHEQSAQEENAWNAQFLYLAVNMMPTHPQRRAWEYKAAELAISANARVIDRQRNATLAGGRQVRHWLHGSNVESDGTVINNGGINPDYMATAAYSASAPLWYSLRRAATPDAMLWGADVIYEALVELVLNGQTIYIDGSGKIFYPDPKIAWSAFRYINFAFFDAVARHFAIDRRVQFAERAEIWEELHARAALSMQNHSGHSDGRTYASDSQDKYKSREEWVTAHAALMYLTKWIAAQNAFVKTSAFIPVVIDNQDDRELTRLPFVWTRSTPAAKDCLGDDNLYAAKGDGSRKVRFHPRLPAGTYRVSAWWSAYHNHATDAPYTIAHTGGPTTVTQDQQRNGGRWNLLGTFTFDGPNTNTGWVELSNKANGYVVADGVMFERI